MYSKMYGKYFHQVIIVAAHVLHFCFFLVAWLFNLVQAMLCV